MLRVVPVQIGGAVDPEAQALREIRREVVALRMLRLRVGPLGKFQQPVGAVDLRLVDVGQIHHIDVRQGLANQPLPLVEPGDTRIHIPGLHGQKLGGGRHQLGPGQEGMSAGEIVAQFKEHTGLDAPGIVSRHAQRDGEPVHGIEGGIQPAVHEQIGVVIE